MSTLLDETMRRQSTTPAGRLHTTMAAVRVATAEAGVQTGARTGG